MTRLMRIKRRRPKFSNLSFCSSRDIRVWRTTSSMPRIIRRWLQLALNAAQRYSQIAPDSPHALHMPSHIFTRLGLWDESIASNLASAASARKQKLAGDELHALDYLVYAYLQTGRFTEARKLTEQLPIVEPDDAARYAGLYATSAIPARYWIERQQWGDAAALPLPSQTNPRGPISRRLRRLSILPVHLAQPGSGTSRAAHAAMEPLLSLRDALAQGGDHDADQANIQLKIVTAWIKWAEGDHECGITGDENSRGNGRVRRKNRRSVPGPSLPRRRCWVICCFWQSSRSSRWRLMNRP